MSIDVAVDPVTFNISRVVTAAVLGGVSGFAASMALEKYKAPKSLFWPIVTLVAVSVALGSFIAGWASINLNLLIGFTMGVLGVGGLLAERGVPTKSLARVFGAILLVIAGPAWLAWNVYSMFQA